MRAFKAALVTVALAGAIAPASADAVFGDLAFSSCVEDTTTPSGLCGGSTGAVGLPQDLVISPSGTSAYSTYGFGDLISQYSRNPTTGALTYVTCYQDAAAGGLCPDANDAPGLNNVNGIAISPDGLSLYAVGTDEDSLVEFARDGASGNLADEVCIDDADSGTDAGCTSTGLALDSPLDVAVAPGGASVYTLSNGDDALAHFDRVASGPQPGLGALTQDADDPCEDTSIGPEVGCSGNAPAFATPRELAISPDGANVYFADSGSDAVAVFDRTTSGDPGDVSEDGCIRVFASAECDSVVAAGLNGASTLTVGPEGNTLYAASIQDNAVVPLTRLAGGTLQALAPCFKDPDATGGTAPCIATDGLGGGPNAGPTGPGGIAVTPDGRSAYVASGLVFATGDDTITSFSRDPVTGVLARTGCIDDTTDGNPSCGASVDLLTGVSGVVAASDTLVYGVGTIDSAIVTFTRDMTVPSPPGVTPPPLTPVAPTKPAAKKCKKKKKKKKGTKAAKCKKKKKKGKKP